MRAATFLAAVAFAMCCNEALAQGTLFEQGAEAERAGNTGQAVPFYIEAVRRGDSRAAARLAEILGLGLGGVGHDLVVGCKWHQPKRPRSCPPPLIGDFPDRKRSRDAGRLVP